MSINPLNDISRVYLDQVAAVEESVRPGNVETPLTKAAFKKRRRSLAGKEASAEARKRGHEGKTWADSGRTYSPDEAKSRRKNMSDTHRSLSYGTAESPDDNEGYPAVKTKNPKKLRKQKAMGELGESSHLEPDMKKRREANEKAVEDMKKTKSYKDMAAAARKKFDEALDPVGDEDADVDNDRKKNTKSDKYLLKRRKAIGKAISTRKESFSNWRDDLIEVVDKINKDKNDEKITGENVDNTKRIKINPNLGEAVEELGGTLLEMVEIEDLEGILDEMSESEIFLLSDDLIEEVVEEFFQDCLEEGYALEYVENTLIESIELSAALLNEANVTLGHDTKIKSDRLQKVKSAVKKVGGAIARGAGYAAGAVVRGAKAAKREFSSGYQRGRQGSGGGSSSTTTSSGSSDSESSASSSSQSGSSRPGLLGRIGSALKSGLKKAVAKGARAVSRGARNVARRMEGGSSSTDSKPTPTSSAKPKVTQGAGAEPAKPKTTATKPADPWEGSATTPPKVKAKKTTTKPKATAAKPKATAAKPKATAAKPKGKKTSKLDDLLASVRNEQVQIDEKTLTAAETKERERIVKSMKDKAADFEKRYPGRGKEVMYATATKMAKKMAEQAMEIQPTSQQPKEKPLDTAAERQKFMNLQTMERRKRQLTQQELNLKKQGKLPLGTD